MQENDDDRIGAGPRLFALSFVALFLELMLIRWVPTTVRLVAYYANLLLISSFLGLGIGAMLAKHRRNTFAMFPVILALDVALLWVCGLGDPLAHAGSEARFFVPAVQTGAASLLNYAVLIGVFIANAVVFVPIGQEIGRRFGRLPPLRAYAWDLSGSLAGTLAFAAFSLTHFSPIAGLSAVMIVYLLLSNMRGRIIAVIGFPVVFALVTLNTESRATWSPYHYIAAFDDSDRIIAPSEAPADLKTMRDPPSYAIRVGLDFYQVHGAIAESRYTPGSPRALVAERRRAQYGLPYALCAGRERVAVLGAGGGQDVEAALLAGVEHVDAIEIDPMLVAISRRMNAADVYGDPRVRAIVDDGRGRMRALPANAYDLLIFGYLDSQSLFSTMSNLRLDGYIYTVESMRLAYERLKPGGLLALSFACPADWIPDKLVNMLRRATGAEPLCYRRNSDLAVCVFRGDVPANVPEQFGEWHRILPRSVAIDLPTDDWPYLYLRGRGVPRDYAIVITALVVLSIAAVTGIRRTQRKHREARSGNDAHFFFLGVAFLLLQTKSITDCTLYFGATWLVTTIVVAGVLLMVMIANLIATRMTSAPFWPYVPLVASLLLLHFMPRDAVLAWPWSVRLAWALLVVPLPVLFAGLIFSTSFRRSSDPAASFGANLIGATIGGFCEYLGMAIGIHALGWIVLAAYVASALSRLRGTSATTGADVGASSATSPQ